MDRNNKENSTIIATMIYNFRLDEEGSYWWMEKMKPRDSRNESIYQIIWGKRESRKVEMTSTNERTGQKCD